MKKQKLDIQELSDNELIKLIKKGNKDFYKEIVRRYQKKLFVYIYHLSRNREEAEDILQNVFIKVLKNVKSFDVERKFSSWIYRIAHNESVNYIKRKSSKKFISLDDISTVKDKLETSSDEESPDEFWFRRELRRDMHVALDKLPQKYREVLVLRYFMNKSYEEMSDILGKPANTIGTLLNRAKDKLSHTMERPER